MKQSEFDGIGRRSFLAGAIGTAISGVAQAVAPCPPQTVSTGNGAPALTTCSPGPLGQLPALRLTSSASGALPWTFGHPFRQGDVPSGKYISATSGTTAFQADVRNRWPDGSVKYAVLSGISNFSAGSQIAVQLGTTSTAPSGGAVAEPSNLANTDVVLGVPSGQSYPISGGTAGTYAINSVLGVNRSTWSLGNGGRVRSIPGPVMSEFHYYMPTNGNNHLAIWWYVRAYSNGAVEVETVLENGWFNEGSPSEYDYNVSVTVNGAVTYSGSSIQHFSHSRWSRVDWHQGGAPIIPQHNEVYLRSTLLVPNYGYNNPDGNAWSGLATAVNPAPFALGNWSANMGDTGAQGAIGLLPVWESLYAASTNANAYNATISNSRGSGRWSINYRDETSGRPLLVANYTTFNIDTGWGPNAPPSATGGKNAYDVPHHPSTGYLAYMIEGRWPMLEAMQLTAAYIIMAGNPATRVVGGYGNGIVSCVNGPYTTRGTAWSWRSVGQAAALSPTQFSFTTISSADLAIQQQFAASISNSCTWMNAVYIAGTLMPSWATSSPRNTIGWLGQYDQYTGGVDNGGNAPSTDWWGGSWMVDFQTQALGHISNLGIEGMPAPSDLATVRNFSYIHVVSELGTESTWNFRRGAVYSRPYLSNSSTPTGPIFYTVAGAFSQYKSVCGLTALTNNSGDPLMAHGSNSVMAAGTSSDTGTGYWASKITALSFAVDHGASGAAAAWALVTAAPNYPPTLSQVNDNPAFAVLPRL